MNIIKPSAEYLDPADFPTLYQFIEKIGRTCYKSEDCITDVSAVKFINDLAGRKHWAMLEHGYLYLTVSPVFQSMLNVVDDKDKRFLHISGNKMSANLRAMYDLLFNSSIAHNDVWHSLAGILRTEYPEVFGADMTGLTGVSASGTEPFGTLLTRAQFIDLCETEHDAAALRECLPHTVLFHVNRGVTHEMVRHRPASFAQESTRYCNYSKGKFGTEITVVMPFWAEDNPHKKEALYHLWKEGCRSDETYYMLMLEMGATPQEARANLPISVKNDIIVTAVEAEWEHILNLRAYGTTGAPHPDMRRVMCMAGPLLNEHSNGRLYPSVYTAPMTVAPEPKAVYLFTKDRDGDLMPVCFGRQVIELKDTDAATKFVEHATAVGFLRNPVEIKENFFLDTTKNHVDLTDAVLSYSSETGWQYSKKTEV